MTGKQLGEEPAYPLEVFTTNGLTKREHIATAAMQGLRSAKLLDSSRACVGAPGELWSPSAIARLAVLDADALLDALAADAIAVVPEKQKGDRP